MIGFSFRNSTGFISFTSGFLNKTSSTNNQICQGTNRFYTSQRIPQWRFTSHRSKLSPNMVFTGIVEEMGVVSNIENITSEAGGVNLIIDADLTIAGVKDGDSISVNGTCLTVTDISEQTFKFGLAPETLRRTNLGQLRSGSKVNLERSLGTDGRFGGHVVQGHVDCTGTIMSITKEKDATWYKINIPEQYMKLIVEKGYIAIDGTSLTVCDVLDDEMCFTFMMISFTKYHVVTATKQEGDLVNIEFDVLGKYVERMLAPRLLSKTK